VPDYPAPRIKRGGHHFAQVGVFEEFGVHPHRGLQHGRQVPWVVDFKREEEFGAQGGIFLEGDEWGCC